MKSAATIIVSIVMSVAVLTIVGIFSSVHTPKDQELSFALDPDSEISPNDRIIHFNPVGDEVVLTIKARGPEDIISNVSAYAGNPLTADVKTAVLGNNASAELTLTGAAGKDIYVNLEPAGGKNENTGERFVNYNITLHVGKGYVSGSSVLAAAVIMALGALLIVTANKQKEDFDERQLAARGQAAMNAFLVAVVCCLGIAVMGRFADSFPLTPYEIAILPAIAGSTAFAIIADINDAYVGFNEKRSKVMAVAWILAVFGIVSSFGFSSKDSTISKSSLACAICFGLYALEMTVKTVLEKKEAADEES